MTVEDMEAYIDTYIDTRQLNLSLSELHQHQGMSARHQLNLSVGLFDFTES